MIRIPHSSIDDWFGGLPNLRSWSTRKKGRYGCISFGIDVCTRLTRTPCQWIQVKGLGMWRLQICWRPVLTNYSCHPSIRQFYIMYTMSWSKNKHNKKIHVLVRCYSSFSPIPFRICCNLFNNRLLPQWKLPGQISTTKILGPKLVKSASSVRVPPTGVNSRDGMGRPWWWSRRGVSHAWRPEKPPKKVLGCPAGT